MRYIWWYRCLILLHSCLSCFLWLFYFETNQERPRSRSHHTPGQRWGFPYLKFLVWKKNLILNYGLPALDVWLNVQISCEWCVKYYCLRHRHLRNEFRLRYKMKLKSMKGISHVYMSKCQVPQLYSLLRFYLRYRGPCIDFGKELINWRSLIKSKDILIPLNYIWMFC